MADLSILNKFITLPAGFHFYLYWSGEDHEYCVCVKCLDESWFSHDSRPVTRYFEHHPSKGQGILNALLKKAVHEESQKFVDEFVADFKTRGFRPKLDWNPN